MKTNTKIYDRIFKPKTIVLANGHSVLKYASRTPLYTVLVLLALVYSAYVTGFDLAIVVKRYNQLTKILGKIFSPTWSYFPNVLKPLVDTLQMSIIGSLIGSFVSLPFAIFASTNINNNRYTVSVLRVILNIVRTLPTIVIASICALIYGLGTFAGTVAISVFTFGVVARMLYESIETIDMGAFEAMIALGANRFQAFWAACMPQILPTYISQSIYSFEINIRAAAILGYVGAGGLGILIQERIGWRDYESLGMVLLSLFVVVFIIENLGQYLRRKLS
ncbi:MAG: phosphonate ABC transporter, permease protein PhnE [Eubacteriales bacterium]|nr:phosphonate ABC transporter, permease protein PhnE [Eubacteriales bacterium]